MCAHDGFELCAFEGLSHEQFMGDCVERFPPILEEPARSRVLGVEHPAHLDVDETRRFFAEVGFDRELAG